MTQSVWWWIHFSTGHLPMSLKKAVPKFLIDRRAVSAGSVPPPRGMPHVIVRVPWAIEWPAGWAGLRRIILLIIHYSLFH
jgi:hypothetical protein